MSHWFNVETKLTSENAIKKAGNSLGFLVVHNQNCRGYNGQRTKCDLVMKLPGEYDMGFKKTKDGYEMVADFWSTHISNHLANPEALLEAETFSRSKVDSAEWDYGQAEAYVNDAKISRFMQAYNRCAVEELIQRQGLQYVETIQQDGTVVLEVVGV